MTLIIIIAIVWAASAVISHARQTRMSRKQARLAQQFREERKARAEEQARVIALEREALRQRREQERERKERERMEREQAAAWERQRKEDAKRDAQIAKHEERIFKLEQKLELAQREEEHQDDVVTAIRVDIAGIEAYVKYCKEKGLLCKGKEDELRKLNDKLYREETKLIKARQTRELCEMQMEVA